MADDDGKRDLFSVALQILESIICIEERLTTMAATIAQLDQAIADLTTADNTLAAAATTLDSDVTALIAKIASGQPVDVGPELALIQQQTSAIAQAASGLATADTAAKGALNPKPVVTSISPATGPVAGGTAVSISGSGFAGATAVNFGSVAATGDVFASDTGISCVSPPGAAGVVDVTVVGPGGTSATSPADQYTYA